MKFSYSELKGKVSETWLYASTALLIGSVHSYHLNANEIVDEKILAAVGVLASVLGYMHYAHTRTVRLTSSRPESIMDKTNVTLLIINIVYAALLYNPLQQSTLPELSYLLLTFTSFLLFGRAIGTVIEQFFIDHTVW